MLSLKNSEEYDTYIEVGFINELHCVASTSNRNNPPIYFPKKFFCIDGPIRRRLSMVVKVDSRSVKTSGTCIWTKLGFLEMRFGVMLKIFPCQVCHDMRTGGTREWVTFRKPFLIKFYSIRSINVKRRGPRKILQAPMSQNRRINSAFNKI
jgi:hypothetical protein